MKFLRNLLASIIGSFITLGIILIFFFLLIAAFGSDEKVTVKSNSVLEIKLDRVVKDYSPKSEDPFDEIFGNNNKKIGRILYHLLICTRKI